MTRSLFVVEDVDGGYVHYRSRYRDELLGKWIPGTCVVEYVPRPRWIPVTERLPEQGRPVLGFSAAVFAVQFVGDRWVHAGPGQEWVGDITHWMPLPEGPEP